MTLSVYVAGAAVLCFVVYRVLYSTDTPHIKGLPEIPGLPLFGSLYELGTNHAKVAQGWAKKYGPVFQVRMGNRVCITLNLRVSYERRRHSIVKVKRINTSSSESSSPTRSTPSAICGSQTNPL